MKRLVAVLLCMTMAVSITACGNSETENNKVAGTEAGDKPESISVICTTDEEGLYEYAGKKYEEMYGVKVNLICQSYDSTHEKITTTWTGGGDADVCYVDIPWVAEFESKGVTIDLSEYMDEDVKNSLIESSLNQMIYNGKTEAIPFANGGKWMFYNKQMLADAGYEEPPKTWDELKEMSQDMMDKGICKYGIAWGASQAEGLICDLTTMIYSFGGTWQKEDGSFDINSESANNAVQFMYDSMQDGWADPASITYTDRDCLDPFMAGDTAFVMNWAYVYGYANNPENSTVAGNVDVCLMPGTDKAESASVTASVPTYPVTWVWVYMMPFQQFPTHPFQNNQCSTAIDEQFCVPWLLHWCGVFPFHCTLTVRQIHHGVHLKQSRFSCHVWFLQDWLSHCPEPLLLSYHYTNAVTDHQFLRGTSFYNRTFSEVLPFPLLPVLSVLCISDNCLKVCTALLHQYQGQSIQWVLMHLSDTIHQKNHSPCMKPLT